MFGRRKNGGASGEAAGFLTDFVKLHVETERMKDAARSSSRNFAILRPQIPIGVGPSAGWFGGHAALPEGFQWPEQGGQKLLFVGQIDLATLPQDLWSGVGPRSGWLGIFLPAQWPPQPTVLHFDGLLVEAKTPPLNSADWTGNHDFKSTKTFALPKWPLIVETRQGDELPGNEASEPIEAPTEKTLLDPSYHPFDRETVGLLCDALEKTVTRLAREIVRFPAMKKLRPADAAWFERQRSVALDTFVRFFETEGRMRTAREFDAPRIGGFIEELAHLDAYDMKYPRNDDEGYCELVLCETKLLSQRLDRSHFEGWWNSYEAGLTSHAIKTYTTKSNENPATLELPRPLRERLEIEWRKQTRAGVAAMGHAPEGHIYTPHGPDTPNEVLLEIQTSKLAGFIWADCYSLVILIDREALRRGDFSAVTFDITN